MHDARADAPLLRREDALELRNHRLGLGVLERQNRHGLVAHPVGVEGQRRLDRRLAVSAVAEDDQEVAGRFGADHAGPRPEAVDQIDQSLRRDVAQRQDGNAVAGPRIAHIGPARDGRSLEHDTVDVAALHERRAVRLKHDLEDRDEVILAQRACRRDGDGAGDRGLDRVAQLKGVAEDRLHHLADIRVLEIQAVLARLEGGGGRIGIRAARAGSQVDDSFRGRCRLAASRSTNPPAGGRKDRRPRWN